MTAKPAHQTAVAARLRLANAGMGGHEDAGLRAIDAGHPGACRARDVAASSSALLSPKYQRCRESPGCTPVVLEICLGARWVEATRLRARLLSPVTAVGMSES